MSTLHIHFFLLNGMLKTWMIRNTIKHSKSIKQTLIDGSIHRSKYFSPQNAWLKIKFKGSRSLESDQLKRKVAFMSFCGRGKLGMYIPSGKKEPLCRFLLEKIKKLYANFVMPNKESSANLAIHF